MFHSWCHCQVLVLFTVPAVSSFMLILSLTVFYQIIWCYFMSLFEVELKRKQT